MSRPPASQIELARLAHRLLWIDEIVKHSEDRYWNIPRAGSDLQADDVATSPFSTSHLVGHCLSTSVDHLRGVRTLLSTADDPNLIRLPYAAQYPPLRAAIECGALAVWLLAPEDRQVRVERTLQAVWEDILQDDRMVIAMVMPRTTDPREDVSHKNKVLRENSKFVRGRKNRARAIAADAGVDKAILERGLPGYGPIVEEAARSTTVDPAHSLGMWRLVSGLTHPSASRSLAMSEVELFDDDLNVDGVSKGRITASPAVVNTAIEAALMFHNTALDLAAERGKNPDIRHQLPPDFPLPPGYIQR